MQEVGLGTGCLRFPREGKLIVTVAALMKAGRCRGQCAYYSASQGLRRGGGVGGVR